MVELGLFGSIKNSLSPSPKHPKTTKRCHQRRKIRKTRKQTTKKQRSKSFGKRKIIKPIFHSRIWTHNAKGGTKKPALLARREKKKHVKGKRKKQTFRQTQAGLGKGISKKRKVKGA